MVLMNGLRADGLKTHVMVAAWEWPSYMDPEASEKGIKVNTSSFYATSCQYLNV